MESGMHQKVDSLNFRTVLTHILMRKSRIYYHNAPRVKEKDSQTAMALNINVERPSE